MVEVFISLGSNIDPERNITEALKLISRYTKILKVSTVYLTEPIGGFAQPKFHNCVIMAETDIGPRVLKFVVLRGIEERLERETAGWVQDVESWDYGPYRVRFEAEAGHIYLLKIIYYNQNEAPPETGPWELKIEDVSSEDKYKGYLKIIIPNRK